MELAYSKPIPDPPGPSNGHTNCPSFGRHTPLAEGLRDGSGEAAKQRQHTICHATGASLPSTTHSDSGHCLLTKASLVAKIKPQHYTKWPQGQRYEKPSKGASDASPETPERTCKKGYLKVWSSALILVEGSAAPSHWAKREAGEGVTWCMLGWDWQHCGSWRQLQASPGVRAEVTEAFNVDMPGRCSNTGLAESASPPHIDIMCEGFGVYQRLSPVGHKGAVHEPMDLRWEMPDFGIMEHCNAEIDSLQCQRARGYKEALHRKRR